jgi:quercetin dioxygenase-like cupin family protein
MKRAQLEHFREFEEGRFTRKTIFKEQETSFFVLNFLPGQELPPHRHPGSRVILWAMEGCGTIRVDGRAEPFARGDAVQCEAGEELSISNTGTEPMSVAVLLAAAAREE